MPTNAAIEATEKLLSCNRSRRISESSLGIHHLLWCSHGRMRCVATKPPVQRLGRAAPAHVVCSNCMVQSYSTTAQLLKRHSICGPALVTHFFKAYTIGPLAVLSVVVSCNQAPCEAYLLPVPAAASAAIKRSGSLHTFPELTKRMIYFSILIYPHIMLA